MALSSFCTAHAILVGGILTAAGTLVVGRQRGQIPYWHPGHWFLIASLLGESIVLLVRLIEHWMVGTYLGYSMQLLQVLGYIPVLLVYAMALFTRDRVVWRVAFGLSLALIMAKLSALAVFLPIGIFRMFGFVEWLQWFGLLFVTITLIIAMVTDIQEKVPRDGLHWAGAVSALLGKCLLIYWFIAV